MTAVTQPWTGHRNVVCGAFAGSLDQQAHAHEVGSVPRLEGRQQLQALAFSVHHHLYAAAILRRGQVTRVLHIESLFWQLVSRRNRQLHRAIRTIEGVCHGVEGQVTGQGNGGHHLG